MPRLQIFRDVARRNLRRDERDVIVRSQEHTELVFSFEQLTHALADRHDMTVSQMPVLSNKCLTRFAPVAIRKHKQVKLRLLEVLEDALPVDDEIRQAVAGFNVA